MKPAPPVMQMVCFPWVSCSMFFMAPELIARGGPARACASRRRGPPPRLGAVRPRDILQGLHGQPHFSQDVCVIGGGGHVGLPFALICADSGLRTVIYSGR